MPIDTCTQAQATAPYLSGICERLAGRYDGDPHGCRMRAIPRAQSCLDDDRLGRRANLLCASMDHREGTACRGDGDCWNSDMRPAAWLRCDGDAGRCAWSPRDGDVSVAPGSCATDNDCPAGQVCALDRFCDRTCAALSDGGLNFDVPRSDAGPLTDAAPMTTVEAGFDVLTRSLRQWPGRPRRRRSREFIPSCAARSRSR
jgi:Cys-rich repeat protein